MTQAILNKEQIATVAGEFTVFHYDGTTGEYLSTSSEYLAMGIGLPAWSCADAPPPVKKGFAVCRKANNAGWEYLPDHRGETVWDTASAQPQPVTAPGDYPNGTTPLAPATRYDKWDGEKWVTDAVLKKAADVAAAKSKKDALIKAAGEAISPLQDASELGMATDEEEARYSAWRQYRVLLMRVDTALAPDIDWPAAPEK